MARRTRRILGGGMVLATIAVLILVLFVVVLSESSFASTVLDQASLEHVGGLELAIAESAVEEMIADLQTHVNDKDGALFRLFRSGAADRPGVEVDLPLGKLPITARLLGEPAYRAWQLSLVEAGARISYQRRIAGLTGDGYGTVTYRATVRSDRHPCVRRTYTAHHDFKNGSIKMPRPFDEPLIWVRRPDALVDLERTNQHAERVHQMRERMLSALARLGANEAAAPFRAQLEELRQQVSRVPRLEPRGGEVHAFAPDMLAFALPRPGSDALEGGFVALAESLRPIWSVIEAEAESVDRVFAAALRDPAGVAGGIAAARGLVEKMREHQCRIRDWQRRFSEYTGDARDELEACLARLDPGLLRKTAFFTLADQDAGRQLEQLQKRLGRLSGVIWIDNPTRPLALPRSAFRGKLVLAVRGDVDVRDIGPEREGDRLTIVCYGRMTIEGRVRASLASLGSLEVGAAGCQLEGNLVADRPDPRQIARMSITRDRSIGTRPAAEVPSQRLVALGPALASREVLRSRDAR